jgi:hypothetical protein
MTHIRLSPVVIVLFATAATAAPGSAQDSFLPEPGARVRVTAPAVARKPIFGTLLEAGEREIVLGGPSSHGTTIPLASITRLERSVRPVGGGPGPAAASPHARPRVRLVPRVGRRTSLTLVVSF